MWLRAFRLRRGYGGRAAGRQQASARSMNLTHPSLVALRHRNFRLLWVGLLLSFTGSYMQNAALLWHVSLLAPPDRKGLALGMVGLVRVVPIITFSMVAGVMADAHSRRRLMLVTQSGAALVAMALSRWRRGAASRRCGPFTRWPRSAAPSAPSICRRGRRSCRRSCRARSCRARSASMQSRCRRPPSPVPHWAASSSPRPGSCGCMSSTPSRSGSSSRAC